MFFQILCRRSNEDDVKDNKNIRKNVKKSKFELKNSLLLPTVWPPLPQIW